MSRVDGFVKRPPLVGFMALSQVEGLELGAPEDQDSAGEPFTVPSQF